MLTSLPVGHFSKDCPQGGGGGACHNCGGEGHFSKDCTEERKIKCRNCDEFGHMSKECPKPRNSESPRFLDHIVANHLTVERVKCMNCQEMGHFKSRCPQPPVEVNNDTGGDGFGGNNDFGAKDMGGNTGGGDWNAAPVADSAPAGDSWGAPAAQGGDNWGAAPAAVDANAWGSGGGMSGGW